jgi:hypothetical protein
LIPLTKKKPPGISEKLSNYMLYLVIGASVLAVTIILGSVFLAFIGVLINRL